MIFHSSFTDIVLPFSVKHDIMVMWYTDHASFYGPDAQYTLISEAGAD